LKLFYLYSSRGIKLLWTYELITGHRIGLVLKRENRKNKDLQT